MRRNELELLRVRTRALSRALSPALCETLVQQTLAYRNFQKSGLTLLRTANLRVKAILENFSPLLFFNHKPFFLSVFLPGKSQIKGATTELVADFVCTPDTWGELTDDAFACCCCCLEVLASILCAAVTSLWCGVELTCGALADLNVLGLDAFNVLDAALYIELTSPSAYVGLTSPSVLALTEQHL